MTVVFALVFLLSAGMLLAYYGEGMRQQQAFRALERITEQANDQAGETSGTAAVQTALSAEEKAAREYNALHEKNPDFWGWIKIDDTALSYPVMHTPEDPEYYLRRDFEGAYSQRGVPFLDGRCYDGCGNYIIYGHYMKDIPHDAGHSRQCCAEVYCGGRFAHTAFLVCNCNSFHVPLLYRSMLISLRAASR